MRLHSFVRLHMTRSRPLCSDFARKVKVELAGLAPEAIEAALADAVAKGNTMPRSLHQSVEPLQQPAVIE
jgi:hypothetical protein